VLDPRPVQAAPPLFVWVFSFFHLLALGPDFLQYLSFGRFLLLSPSFRCVNRSSVAFMFFSYLVPRWVGARLLFLLLRTSQFSTGPNQTACVPDGSQRFLNFSCPPFFFEQHPPRPPLRKTLSLTFVSHGFSAISTLCFSFFSPLVD